MAREIAGVDDLPNFDNIPALGISPEVQRDVDIALAAFGASLETLAASSAEAQAEMQALLSWSALADRLVNLVMPIMDRYMARNNVPEVERPKRWQTALPGLIGVLQSPAADRPAALGTLLAGLL